LLLLLLQMHVHIAQMYKGLEQIIDQVAKSGVTEAFLSCKGSSVRRRVESCTVLGSGNKDNDVRVSHSSLLLNTDSSHACSQVAASVHGVRI
jgi:hypothetical protein